MEKMTKEAKFAKEIEEEFPEFFFEVKDAAGNVTLRPWAYCPFCKTSLEGTGPWDECPGCGAT